MIANLQSTVSVCSAAVGDGLDHNAVRCLRNREAETCVAEIFHVRCVKTFFNQSENRTREGAHKPAFLYDIFKLSMAQAFRLEF